MARKKVVPEVAPEAVAAEVTVIPTKEPNGLRHAIRLGVMSAKEAFRKLKTKYSWIDPRTRRWYDQRIAKEKT